MTTYVRRPWVDYFDSLVHNDAQLDQQSKLLRNQIASLDLGNPHFKLYDSHFQRNGVPRERPSSRESYLEWVADWKRTYGKLTTLVRALKTQRGRAGFGKVEELLRKENPKLGNQERESVFYWNERRLMNMLETLRAGAQVMLNARFNAKLAAAELRRRAHESKALSS